MNRSIIIAALILTSCKLGAGPPPTIVCNAQHSWESYHLAHDNLSPVIVNHSDYTPDLASWNSLNTPITLRASGDGFPITIEEGACDGCLGRATVRALPGGHVVSATVTMNRALLDRYGPNVAQRVLCQEIGHLLGLGHNRGQPGGERPLSCMDDCSGAAPWYDCISNPLATRPNAHDAKQLRKIYAHVGDGAGDGPGCVGSIVVHSFPVPSDS